MFVNFKDVVCTKKLFQSVLCCIGKHHININTIINIGIGVNTNNGNISIIKKTDL